MITVLANDPGTKNYGVACVSFKVKGSKVLYKVHETGKLTQTADIKNDVQKELKAYVKGVRKYVTKHKPTHIIAERYMTRGIKGPLVESVNMMLGAVVITFPKPITLVPAVVWKNRVNKFFDLKAFYKEALVEAHEIDAVLMSMFLAEKLLKKDVLVKFSKPKARRDLLETIHKCTTSKLKKRKVKKKKSRAR